MTSHAWTACMLPAAGQILVDTPAGSSYPRSALNRLHRIAGKSGFL